MIYSFPNPQAIFNSRIISILWLATSYIFLQLRGLLWVRQRVTIAIIKIPMQKTSIKSGIDFNIESTNFLKIKNSISLLQYQRKATKLKHVNNYLFVLSFFLINHQIVQHLD